jgi:hypothetical protein
MKKGGGYVIGKPKKTHQGQSKNSKMKPRRKRLRGQGKG